MNKEEALFKLSTREYNHTAIIRMIMKRRTLRWFVRTILESFPDGMELNSNLENLVNQIIENKKILQYDIMERDNDNI